MILTTNAKQLMTAAVAPMAIELASGETAVTYQGPSQQHSGADDKACWFVRSGHTPVYIGEYSCDPADGHGGGSICERSPGELHIFYGCHVTPMRHAVSYDNGLTWNPASEPSNYATYPSAMVHDGTIYLTYRAGSHTDDWKLAISADGTNWQTSTLINSIGNRTWYASFTIDDHGDIHIAANYHGHNQGGIDAHNRRGLRYICRKANGRLANADGIEIDAPMYMGEGGDRNDTHFTVGDFNLFAASNRWCNGPTIDFEDTPPSISLNRGNGPTSGQNFERWQISPTATHNISQRQGVAHGGNFFSYVCWKDEHLWTAESGVGPLKRYDGNNDLVESYSPCRGLKPVVGGSGVVWVDDQDQLHHTTVGQPTPPDDVWSLYTGPLTTAINDADNFRVTDGLIEING
jgi:hypothetical protein